MEEAHVESVKVWIKAFTDSILDQYLKTKDSLGKAGAYSIQGEGAHLIEKIEGDYPTVVGLPLWHIAKLLERHGVALPKSVEEIYRTKPYANWKEFS
jgi:septum formation protein